MSAFGIGTSLPPPFLATSRARHCFAGISGMAIIGFLPISSAFAQASGAEIETVGLGTTLGILAFLAIAALVIVSTLCKVLVIAGLVPRRRKSRLRRTIIWLANVAGEVRIVSGRRDEPSGGRSSGGGGGSSGGAGASGEF